MADPNIGICEKCLGCIEGLVERDTLGPFEVETRRTLCDECSFAGGWRLSQCVRRCPYKVPPIRPTKDGKAPAVFLEYCRERRRKQKERQA